MSELVILLFYVFSGLLGLSTGLIFFFFALRGVT